MDDDRRYRLRLAIFWSGVIAAAAVAFATGLTGWQDYIAKETARQQLRARIVVMPQRAPTVEEGNLPRVRSTLQNLGQTPGFDAGSMFRVTVADYPLADKLTTEDCSNLSPILKKTKWFVGKIPLPETNRETPLAATEFQAIKETRAAIYFYGRVCYLDIFNESHRTDFCVYWKWDAGRMSPGLYCDQGNSAS